MARRTTWETRDRRLHVRIGPSDVRRLRDLAERDGLDISGAVRSMIARAHREAFGGGRSPTPEAAAAR
jgi:hypothetical protein